MPCTIDELKKTYDEEIKKLLDINALQLPKGKNNIFTLVYLPFFELKSLNLKQKGILIHLFIRGGNDRIILKSAIKLSKTLGIDRVTYTRNLTKLEKMSYIKKYIQVVDVNLGTLPDIIYVNPLDDKTGLPIKSNEEEIQLSLDAAKDYLNKYSKYIIKLQEKPNEDDSLDIDDIRLEQKEEIEKLINNSIFIPAYIAFMENPLLSIVDKVVYLYLALRSGENSVVFESKVSLSDKLKIDPKTLKKSLDRLEELQYIKKFKRYQSDGTRTSDILYVNQYDRFNGLPEINDSIMNFKMERAKELYFRNYIIKEHFPKISAKKQNEVFSSQLKQLLQMDSNISDISYETFIENNSFEIKDDVIKMIIHSSLSALKENIDKQFSEYIKHYTKALLKSNKEFFVVIQVSDK